MTQLARNVATTYAARFAIVCSGIFLFPFVTHHVGLSQYGLWLLVNGVTVFFLTADFGMGTSVVRYVADYEVGRNTRPVVPCACVPSTLAMATPAACVDRQVWCRREPTPANP